MRFSALARWYGRAPRRSHTGRGQALVEFALMALLFFTLLFGIMFGDAGQRLLVRPGPARSRPVHIRTGRSSLVHRLR